MKAEIKREFTLILIGSLLTTILFVVGWHFPIKLTLISTLLVNFSLMICTWYSERNNRPILFQVMYIFYLSITAYCIVSIDQDEIFGMPFDGHLAASLSLMLLMGVIVVTFSCRQSLARMLKKRVDIWLPPIWPVVIAGVISYAANKSLEINTLRMCVMVGAIGLVAATAYKNNRMQNRRVAYEVSTRHYMWYLSLFSVVFLAINLIIPKVNKLPGTNLIKQLTNNWGQGIVGDIDETVKLDRNPSQSEEVVLYVKSEGAVYLRNIAYSKYEDGKWSIDKEDSKIKPLEEDQLYNEYDLFELMVNKLSKGQIDNINIKTKYANALSLPMYTPTEKKAYVEEVKDFGYYFTINGLKKLDISDGNQVGYLYDINDLVFAGIGKKNDTAYTIEYNTYRPKAGTREEAVLRKLNIEDFQDMLSSAEFADHEKTAKISKLIDRSKNYIAIKSKYTQIPENVDKQIRPYANKIVSNLSGDMEKAEAICNYLKKSGLYNYKLGAKYTNPQLDPVVDFLLYGGEGICQDFASAMTLLCRSIGLPARYVTGYYSIQRSETKEQVYDVRIKDGHAFVEVYIAGYGWMLFDPTPNTAGTFDETMTYNNAAMQQQGNGNLGDGKIVIIIIICIGAVLIWIYPVSWLKTFLYKWYLLRLPPKRSVVMLMKQTIRFIEEKGIYMQDEETVSQYAKRLSDKGIDITPITKSFEAAYYGQKTITPAEMERALNCYKALRKKKNFK